MATADLWSEEASLQTLRLLARMLRGRAAEYSGVVCEDGSYSMLRGSSLHAPVEDGGELLWHSHPSGPPVFSLEDWIVFFSALSPRAALIADGQMLLLQKNAEHQSLYTLMQAQTTAFQGYPSLLYLKLVTTLQDFFDCELTDLADPALLVAARLPDTFRIKWKLYDLA